MRQFILVLVVLACTPRIFGRSDDYTQLLRDADDALRGAAEVSSRVDFSRWKAPRSYIDSSPRQSVISASEETRRTISRILSNSKISTGDLLTLLVALHVISQSLTELSWECFTYDRHSPLVQELHNAATATLLPTSKLKSYMYKTLSGLESQATACDKNGTACSQTSAKESKTAERGSAFTLDCGDTLSKDKIPVLLTIGDQTPADIASLLRQKIRAIPDVDVVYSMSEAAIEIMILAYENRTEGGIRMGYTLSAVTAAPCKSSAFGQTMDIPWLNGHFLLTGNSPTQIVEQAVANLDNQDLEGQRRTRSLMRSMKQNP